MENNVPGFTVQPSYIRDYKTDYAAHLLGYIGMMNDKEAKEYQNYGYPLNAMVGKDGAEKAFESYLHGVDGTAVVTTTRGGSIISTNSKRRAEQSSLSYRFGTAGGSEFHLTTL